MAPQTSHRKFAASTQNHLVERYTSVSSSSAYPLVTGNSLAAAVFVISRLGQLFESRPILYYYCGKDITIFKIMAQFRVHVLHEYRYNTNTMEWALMENWLSVLGSSLRVAYLVSTIKIHLGS
jgi:hypothetical protein